MELVFYFMHKSGEKAEFDRVEREAVPDERYGELYGYDFGVITDQGRPFHYIRREHIGIVFTDHGMPMLVLKKEDAYKAKSIWNKYFNNEINGRKRAITRILNEKKVMQKSNVFDQDERKVR